MLKAMVGAQAESSWRWTHALGKATLVPNLGQTLALNDGRSNELCLSAPSWTGSQ